MNRIFPLVFTLSLPLLGAVPMAADAQTEDLEFIGIVTSATAGVAVGTTVTGTYGFSLNPAVYTGFGGQVSGAVGSSNAPWSVTLNEAEGFVFSDTVQVAGAPSYRSDYWYYGDSTVSGGGHTLQGSEVTGDGGDLAQSSVTLDPRGTGSAFLRDGLPNLKNISLAGSTGMFQTSILNSNFDSDTTVTVDYKITSLTEVSGPASTKAPEIDPPSAASGLALLIGGMLVMRGRKAHTSAA